MEPLFLVVTVDGNYQILRLADEMHHRDKPEHLVSIPMEKVADAVQSHLLKTREPGDWRVNDVVQIDPEHDELFGGCFMVITEPKTWGAQGFVPMGAKAADSGKVGLAYYRCPTEKMALIGRAEWSEGDEKESASK